MLLVRVIHKCTFIIIIIILLLILILIIIIIIIIIRIIIIIINNYSPKVEVASGGYLLSREAEIINTKNKLIWMISSLFTGANRTPFSLELLGGK